MSTNLFFTPSEKYKIINVHPNISRTNKSDGGYFVTLIKDRKENNTSFCADHGESPYTLINRIMINKANDESPIFNKKLFLFDSVNSNNIPAAKPTNMIPNHGMGGYPTIKIVLGASGNDAGPNKGESIVLKTDPSENGMIGKRL